MKANTHLSKAIIHSKNGQRNGGKENRKLGPQKNNLKINKQLPEMSILNTVWQCRIRLLAQCRRRQLSSGPAKVHFLLTACAIFQEAFLVGSHSRCHSEKKLLTFFVQLLLFTETALALSINFSLTAICIYGIYLCGIW